MCQVQAGNVILVAVCKGYRCMAVQVVLSIARYGITRQRPGELGPLKPDKNCSCNQPSRACSMVKASTQPILRALPRLVHDCRSP